MFARRIGAALGMFTLAATMHAQDLLRVYSDFSSAGTPNLPGILEQMSRAQAEQRAKEKSFTVTRLYKLYGSDPNNPKSEVIATVAFAPPHTKAYRIESTKGNDRGAQVVKHILENEAEVARHPEMTAIDLRNYDFHISREDRLDGHPCYVLTLFPKRSEKNLIKGSVWVDAESFLIRRIEGEPAKNSSFWVHNVHVVLNYGNDGDDWVLQKADANADVRILGPSSLVVRDQQHLRNLSLWGANP